MRIAGPAVLFALLAAGCQGSRNGGDTGFEAGPAPCPEYPEVPTPGERVLHEWNFFTSTTDTSFRISVWISGLFVCVDADGSGPFSNTDNDQRRAAGALTPAGQERLLALAEALSDVALPEDPGITGFDGARDYWQLTLGQSEPTYTYTFNTRDNPDVPELEPTAEFAGAIYRAMIWGDASADVEVHAHRVW
ncbi:MAG: hypothetical protein EP330_13980 [Deltaproteobacteria bacterium]|nr:MAG: hypothetical protein EP330_13980 [Deltaproteobacteria bacterium]